MHWLPIAPRRYAWPSILLEAEYPRATVQPEGLSQWKIAVAPSDIEPTAFLLVVQDLDQLCHCITQPLYEIQ